MLVVLEHLIITKIEDLNINLQLHKILYPTQNSVSVCVCVQQFRYYIFWANEPPLLHFIFLFIHLFIYFRLGVGTGTQVVQADLELAM